MSVEDNKKVTRRYYEEVVNTGDVDRTEEFIGEDYTEVMDGVRYPVGIQGAREHVIGVRQTYPDLFLTIDHQIAEGEWVVSCITVRATHAGWWIGIKPTGKQVVYTGVNVDRVVGGRIVEHGGAANMLGPLLEIGAVKVVGEGEKAEPPVHCFAACCTPEKRLPSNLPGMKTMRSEQEMLDLILSTARGDERIRAAVLNGSRANPNAPRDIFQDFDVVYFVTEAAPFRHNRAWVRRFGELMILQEPEDMREAPPGEHEAFSTLMQFTDGNRIDLWIVPLEQRAAFLDDSLSLLLLDKDGILPPFAPPDESSYRPRPPAARAFADCCNEFWWVCPYAAKGLWREEITYARAMLDEVLREQLMKMLAWHIGVQTGFSAYPGKNGKYFKKYLQPELWELLLKTYADADCGHTWEALDAMCRLFRTAALQVAGHFGFEYPQGDDERVADHLRHVRSLPRDAEEMY